MIWIIFFVLRILVGVLCGSPFWKWKILPAWLSQFWWSSTLTLLRHLYHFARIWKIGAPSLFANMITIQRLIAYIRDHALLLSMLNISYTIHYGSAALNYITYLPSLVNSLRYTNRTFPFSTLTVQITPIYRTITIPPMYDHLLKPYGYILSYIVQPLQLSYTVLHKEHHRMTHTTLLIVHASFHPMVS